MKNTGLKKKDKVNEIISLIEGYTYETGNKNQCKEINSEFCSKCADFVKKIKAKMMRL